VSCYAFFKGWLLLSKPPGCQSDGTSFGILNRYLGPKQTIWAVALSTMALRCHCLTPVSLRAGIRSLSGLGRPRRPPHLNSSSTPCRIIRGCSEKHFEENQLSPGSVSFSLQSTSHPRVLRYSMVRTSSYLSVAFILLMDSSPGFGSSTSDKTPYLRLAFAPDSTKTVLSKPLATKSLDH